MPRVYETFDSNGKPHRKKRFNYTNYKGKRTTGTGTSSWKETRKIAQDVQAKHDRIRKGLEPHPKEESKHAKRPFEEVVEEYLSWGNSQGGRGGKPWGKVHSRMKKSHLTWWQKTLKIKKLGDLDSILPKAEKALQELQVQGKSGKTLSNYAGDLNSFCIWCINKSRKYLSENPIEGISDFDITPKSKRRLLTLKEIHKILNVAPLYRSILYQVSFCSGCRANELRQMSEDHLDIKLGGLHLDAEWTKNRKPGFQPLPKALVTSLVDFMESHEALRLYDRHYIRSDSKRENIPEYPLLFVPTHTARVLDIDMEKAGINKWTKDGKVDFHACRVAYITYIFDAGANVKEAQSLARHADAQMTMNIYGRTQDERLRDIAERLGGSILPSKDTEK